VGSAHDSRRASSEGRSSRTRAQAGGCRRLLGAVGVVGHRQGPFVPGRHTACITFLLCPRSPRTSRHVQILRPAALFDFLDQFGSVVRIRAIKSYAGRRGDDVACDVQVLAPRFVWARADKRIPRYPVPALDPGNPGSGIACGQQALAFHARRLGDPCQRCCTV